MSEFDISRKGYKDFCDLDKVRYRPIKRDLTLHLTAKNYIDTYLYTKSFTFCGDLMMTVQNNWGLNWAKLSKV